MLRARVGAAQVEVPGDFAIGIREMGGVGGGCDGSGITVAVMDVAGPEARCEQAEGRHQATAVHAEQLILVGDSQLEGAYRVDARDEVDDDAEVGRAVSQRAGDESKVLAALAILLPPAWTVDPGYFVPRAKAALSMSWSILPARCATVYAQTQEFSVT